MIVLAMVENIHYLDTEVCLYNPDEYGYASSTDKNEFYILSECCSGAIHKRHLLEETHHHHHDHFSKHWRYNKTVHWECHDPYHMTKIVLNMAVYISLFLLLFTPLFWVAFLTPPKEIGHHDQEAESTTALR